MCVAKSVDPGEVGVANSADPGIVGEVNSEDQEQWV